MILEQDMYVPAIGWRQGEYQALLELSDASKAKTIPLITIPQIEYDFEAQALKKSPHEHIFPFPKRFKSKWNRRPCWIDLHSSLHDKTMNEGETCYEYIFAGIREFSAQAVPVASMSMTPAALNLLRSEIALDQHGVGLRLRMEDVMEPGFATSIASILNALAVEVEETDLLIDLVSPNFEPYPDFANALLAVFQSIPLFADYRNVVVVSTAMPESLADVTKAGGSLPRHDWNFYRVLIDAVPATLRVPNFGDYTIVNPSFVALDMRMLQPAGKVVYATSDSWVIKKGGSFRAAPEQMHDHCSEIVSSPHFKGAHFSYGDRYISECAAMREGPSNQTQWKKIAINHHMTLVLDDLATLHAPP